MKEMKRKVLMVRIEDKGQEMVKEEMGEQPVKLEGCLADDALKRNVSLLKKEMGTAYVYTADVHQLGDKNYLHL